MKILDAYRRKGFVFCIRDVMKRFMPVWCTRSRQAIDALYAQRTYHYLCRRYKALAQLPLSPITETQAPKTIWVCWLQGFDKAPLIVQKCLEQMEKYCQGYEIICIDAQNMHQYAALPSFLLERYAKGRIPHAHFSDVLRTVILVEHGGIWIDSTVLLTAPIPENILGEPFFMFQNMRPFRLPHATSNWFIVCAKEHPMMKRQLELLYAFWKRERGLIDYFNYYILFYILITENQEAKAQFDRMLDICNADALMLQAVWTLPFSQKQWCQICSLTPIHKLNWKISEEQLLRQGTYLDFVLRCL